MHKYIRGELISRNVLATVVYYCRFNLFHIPTLKTFRVTNEVFDKKEYNIFKTDYMYIDKEVNSLC